MLEISIHRFAGYRAYVQIRCDSRTTQRLVLEADELAPFLRWLLGWEIL